MAVDYSLYLVTDSTPAVLGDRDLVQQVEEALKGGVTIVQYRDKTSDTATLIRMGAGLHAVCRKYNVPLLINDRSDVAQAIGCEGVHIGQEDMDYATARKILGPDMIIGVTVSRVAEAIIAGDQFSTYPGPSYLGIGTVFATPTKEDTKSIIGPEGVRKILSQLSDRKSSKIPTVAIGGINTSNVQRVMFQSKSPEKGLDGIAVVSGIMAAKDPRAAAGSLRRLISDVPATMSPWSSTSDTIERMIKGIPAIVCQVSSTSPLCHNMTNLVVQNFAANVATAIGASPIMANYGEEARDLASLGGSLVVNMGTVTPDGIINYEKAIKAYNEAGRPILLDPVGAGATAVRRNALKRIMKSGYFSVIKGNESEIRTVLGHDSLQQKGVDSGASTSTDVEKARMVKEIALRERTVVLMTGKTDFLSDGNRSLSIKNGHEYLGNVTGSGCTLGTTVAAFLAVHDGDKFLAALAGVLLFEIAAELAAVRADVRGPGSFIPAFLDELYLIRLTSRCDNNEWLKLARIQMIHD